jgi:hypothetical protein
MSVGVLAMASVSGAEVPAGRLPRLDRWVSAAAAHVCTGRPTPGAVVFGTGYGGLASTLDFLEGMAARGAAFGSPTAFHESVHHAPLGQLSIQLGITGPCLTVSSRELSGESALQTALSLVARGHAPVLVVCADERVTALVNAYEAFGAAADWTESATAVLLGEGAATVRIEDVRLAGITGPTLRFPEESSRLLPLLRSLRPELGHRPVVWGAGGGDAAALAEAFPDAEQRETVDPSRVHPSGGLMRVVAAAQHLRAGSPGRRALVHGLGLGGGQAAVVLHHVG